MLVRQPAAKQAASCLTGSRTSTSKLSFMLGTLKQTPRLGRGVLFCMILAKRSLPGGACKTEGVGE
jgi:hypothetical protein